MSSLVAVIATLFRTCLLLFLVAGLTVRPMIGQLSQLHEAEHTVLAALAGADDHSHDEHSHSHPDPFDDTDHATGLHSLMHQAEVGSWTSILTHPSLVPSLPPARLLPLPGDPWVRAQPAATPFRPPIV